MTPPSERDLAIARAAIDAAAKEAPALAVAVENSDAMQGDFMNRCTSSRCRNGHHYHPDYCSCDGGYEFDEAGWRKKRDELLAEAILKLDPAEIVRGVK